MLVFVSRWAFPFQVECTWDETDPDRVQILRRNFTDKDLEQMDLDNYLASSSSEDEGGSSVVNSQQLPFILLVIFSPFPNC